MYEPIPRRPLPLGEVHPGNWSLKLFNQHDMFMASITAFLAGTSFGVILVKLVF